MLNVGLKIQKLIAPGATSFYSGLPEKSDGLLQTYVPINVYLMACTVPCVGLFYVFIQLSFIVSTKIRF